MSSYGIWLSAAGMKVSEHRQTLMANNLANANTIGFKQDLAIIRERRIESQSSPEGFEFVHPVLDSYTGGLNVRPTNYSFAQGDLEPTGKPTDVAIDGDGFFSVSDGENIRYTRNGNFSVNNEGYFILSSGGGRWKVLDDTGSPVQIDTRLDPPTITSNGTIQQGELLVAKLGLMTTENKQSLRKIGETLFDAGDVEMQPIEGRFITRTLEQSNYNIMKGLASMIEASRSYEMNANLIRLQDQMTGQAVSTIGRLA